MSTKAFEKFYQQAAAFAVTRERVSREFKGMTEAEQEVIIRNYLRSWKDREEVISIIAHTASLKPVLASE